MEDLLLFVPAAVQLVTTLVALAGGGGSSSDSGGDSSWSDSDWSSSDSYDGSSGGGDMPPWLALCIFLFVMGYAIYTFYRHRKSAATNAILAVQQGVQNKSQSWRQDDPLAARAADVFTAFQSDWSNFTVESMQAYLAPQYYQHMQLVLAALKLAGRQNIIKDVVVRHVDTTKIDDTRFQASIEFAAYDMIIDTRSNATLYHKRLSGFETYNFIRSGEVWVLEGIDQPTASMDMKNSRIAAFAQANSLFYSLDWGHLLIPNRGQIFEGMAHGVSDINNHTIGLYHDLVIQIYSYIATPGKSLEYTIAQVNIPRSYGNILVRRKKKLFGPAKPKGMEQLQTEWREFNDTYEVFATNLELATSFELLTPSYMEQLVAVGFEVNIEVADNVVYLYAQDSEADYEKMLALLKVAFKEMKM